MLVQMKGRMCPNSGHDTTEGVSFVTCWYKEMLASMCNSLTRQSSLLYRLTFRAIRQAIRLREDRVLELSCRTSDG
jgi:hypothetical protein